MQSLATCVDIHRQWKKREGIHPPFAWGVPFLDRELGDACPGNVYLVAGDPNRGKSMFTLLLVTSCSEPSLILSYEDEPSELGARVQGQPAKALERVHVAFPTNGSIKAAEPTVRWAAPVIRLLVVDYLGLLTYSGDAPTWSRTDEVREILKVLKGWARELGLVVVLVAHTKRRDQQQSKPPKMWDLSESSSLERMAKAIVMVWQPPTGRVMEAIVEKSKSTRTGGTACYERGENGWLTEVSGRTFVEEAERLCKVLAAAEKRKQELEELF